MPALHTSFCYVTTCLPVYLGLESGQILGEMHHSNCDGEIMCQPAWAKGPPRTGKTLFLGVSVKEILEEISFGLVAE